MTTSPTALRDARRVAVVTGASRGIGRAVVLELASQGAAVVVAFHSKHDEADKVVATISAAGGTAIPVQADVADTDAVAHLFDIAERAYGGVDIVVHAAGRMTLSTIADLDVADLDSLHRTNIRGTFLVAQQAARRVRPGGSVVTFSTSVVGLQLPTYGAYAASKGAVEAITMILARELRGRDVNVNAVAPGPTATELFLDGKDDATLERLATHPPLERLGDPDDIAAVTAFLVSPAGHWVNGQVVRANGGIV
jgi:3-oxoacyl-[acyl-carrier protein] reductase